MFPKFHDTIHVAKCSPRSQSLCNRYTMGEIKDCLRILSLWALYWPCSKTCSQFCQPKYATPLRIVETHHIDYGDEDEDGLENDEVGSIFVHAKSTTKTTNKDWQTALTKRFWQSMSQEDQTAWDKVSDDAKKHAKIKMCQATNQWPQNQARQASCHHAWNWCNYFNPWQKPSFQLEKM